ncbi:hypothetical protein [Nocardia asteroides]
MSSVVATLLVSITVLVIGLGKSSISDVRAFWLITRRLKRNGVDNFFAKRSDYVRYRRHGTIQEYVNTAKHDLKYVGFWLAHGVEISNIGEHLAKMAQSGRSVEIVLLDPTCSYLPFLAQYLNLPEAAVASRIYAALNQLQKAREDVPANLAHLFRIKLHTKMITASAFLVDSTSDTSRLLVDFKLYGADRDNTFGIEFKRVSTEDSLYKRVYDSYDRICTSAIDFNGVL